MRVCVASGSSFALASRAVGHRKGILKTMGAACTASGGSLTLKFATEAGGQFALAVVAVGHGKGLGCVLS